MGQFAVKLLQERYRNGKTWENRTLKLSEKMELPLSIRCQPLALLLAFRDSASENWPRITALFSGLWKTPSNLFAGGE